jgi:hypothetical protein
MISLVFVFVTTKDTWSDRWDVRVNGRTDGADFRVHIYQGEETRYLHVYANRSESFAYLGGVDTLQQAEELILWALASTITEEKG